MGWRYGSKDQCRLGNAPAPVEPQIRCAARELLGFALTTSSDGKRRRSIIRQTDPYLQSRGEASVAPAMCSVVPAVHV